MKYTDNEMSTILLCSRVGIGKDEHTKTLTLGEWNKFIEKLVEYKLEPKVVLEDCNRLKELGYDQSECDRFARLADRGAAAAMILNDYEQRGIYVKTMLSDGYPVMLKRVLGTKKPPVFFYAGNIDLAHNIGIGVVGSRNLSSEGLEFIKALINKAIREKLVVYSGGARGADQTAEISALGNGGAVVEYLADSLVSKVKKKEINQQLVAGNMLIFSDMLPTAGFTAARAMNRNKYIYASAYGTFVAESDYNKGGTWTGAKEAMRHEWGKVLVWNDSASEGNRKLIESGALPYSLSDVSLLDVITGKTGDSGNELTASTQNSSPENEEHYTQLSLFDSDESGDPGVKK